MLATLLTIIPADPGLQLTVARFYPTKPQASRPTGSVGAQNLVRLRGAQSGLRDVHWTNPPWA